MRISINAPSWKRPYPVKTLKRYPFVKIWICETEEKEYRKTNPKAQFVTVKKGIQGNLCRIKNHILDSEFERGIDAVCMVDDDLSYLAFFEGNKRHKLKAADLRRFLLRGSVLCRDLGAKLWGVNVNSDKQCYREYSPFSMLSYIGGPFSVHLKNPLRYDLQFPLKQDYDLTLQHLNKYRKVLRWNKYYYLVDQGGSGTGQPGGCAVYRSTEKEKTMMSRLQNKWGTGIVRYDGWSRNHMTTKNHSFDINPVIKVPIRGI